MTNLLPGQSDRANGTRILGGSESEVHPKRGKCSWFGRSKTRDDAECVVELEGETRALYITVVGKLLYMC